MEYTREDHDRCYGADRPKPRRVGRFLLFWGAAVLALMATVYGVTAAALSLAKPEQPSPMPAATKTAYESRESLRHLRHPCELPYAHRGANGRWVQGCAK